eukprot:325803-Chlamydomonas_euryale.AAC.6
MNDLRRSFIHLTFGFLTKTSSPANGAGARGSGHCASIRSSVTLQLFRACQSAGVAALPRASTSGLADLLSSADLPRLLEHFAGVPRRTSAIRCTSTADETFWQTHGALGHAKYVCEGLGAALAAASWLAGRLCWHGALGEVSC